MPKTWWRLRFHCWPSNIALFCETRERLDHCETRENCYYPRSFRKMPYRRTRDNDLIDRILLWAVQSQGELRSISTKLSPDRHRGRPPHPSQRSGGCSTVIEEREASWNWQHPSRTGPRRWRGRNYCSHNKILQTGEWPTLWIQSLDITFPKTGNQCQNYRPISLISHTSKVMLKIILNRMKPQAEKIIAEEQAGLRAGRSTIEQIFNLRILC